MRFFATLAVVFVAAVVFVSATPIPSEYQFDLDTREFSSEHTLFERAGLWGGVKNAAKSTWDYAAKKIFRIGTQQSPRPAGPGPFSRPLATRKAEAEAQCSPWQDHPQPLDQKIKQASQAQERSYAYQAE